MYHEKVPEVLKCALCALWAESKVLAPFRVFFCRQKSHGDSRAPLNVLRTALAKYIGKLETNIIDSSIQFSVNFMQVNSSIMDPDIIIESAHGTKEFPQAPIIDSETRY